MVNVESFVLVSYVINKYIINMMQVQLAIVDICDANIIVWYRVIHKIVLRVFKCCKDVSE